MLECDTQHSKWQMYPLAIKRGNGNDWKSSNWKSFTVDFPAQKNIQLVINGILPAIMITSARNGCAGSFAQQVAGGCEGRFPTCRGGPKIGHPPKSKRFIMTLVFLAQSPFSDTCISPQCSVMHRFAVPYGGRIDGLEITATLWKSTQRVQHPTTGPRVQFLR